MKKRKGQKLEINYEYIQNNAQLKQGFEILAESFYRNQKKIKKEMEIKRILH